MEESCLLELERKQEGQVEIRICEKSAAVKDRELSRDSRYSMDNDSS